MGMNDVAGTGTIAEAEGVGDGWMGVAGSGVIVLTDDAGVNGVATAADTDGVKMGFIEDVAEVGVMVDKGAAGVSAVVVRSLAVGGASAEVVTGVPD